ncbi:3-hydroxyindolin-2-one monooxygenase [Acorus calamus]|uniref:3-hydroxyindolin-2-one monooxygenase n=1 Tax=Acorus calamus TaxID=4465 RepID=A0AAV9D351_ACOCL|nr:3-hydroxyindolin-2-one monooxygenase [Acorus calamus]
MALSLIQRIASSYPNPVNLTKMLGLYANDVLCIAAFGKVFSEGEEYDRRELQKMFEDIQVLLGGFNLGDFYPSREWISHMTGMKRRLDYTFQRFDHLINEVIKQHVEHPKQSPNEQDFVDVLLDLQKSEGLERPLTLDNIKAIILVRQ